MNPINVIHRMRHSSIRNYGVPALTSYAIGGRHHNHGMVRLFEADRTIWERITPHSHRFDFAAFVVKGRVQNIEFIRAQSEKQYNDVRANPHWVSFLNILRDVDGNPIPGKYAQDEGYGPVSFFEKEHNYTEGDWYTVKHDEIHTIHFEKGTQVLMFEGPNVSDRSIILEPFANGIRVPTFKVDDWMFQGEHTL
jgi:hypothetical protein